MRQGQNSYLLDVTVLSDTPTQPQRGIELMKRHKIPMKKGKRSFTKSAIRVHGKNNPHKAVMRGGIRL